MVAGATGVSAEALSASLAARIDETLRPLLPANGRVALLDFPNYANVGDSAIWVGELDVLAAAGCRVVYRCDPGTYARDDLRARLGDGTILLSGGGNLGDLWPRIQAFRERVIADFPDRPIIQLPQTIHFGDAAQAARARSVFDAHPQVVLLVRDAQSLAHARELFRAESRLCPDMAFALPGMPAVGEPQVDVVALLRDDIESAGARAAVPDGLVVEDWGTEPGTIAGDVHDWLRVELGRRPRVLRPLRPWLDTLQTVVARQRLARGCRILTRGRVVVTDRLHGHILALRLGLPHVLVDNSYGKLRAFVEAWTGDCALTHWQSSIAAAMDLARVLAAERRTGLR